MQSDVLGRLTGTGARKPMRAVGALESSQVDALLLRVTQIVTNQVNSEG